MEKFPTYLSPKDIEFYKFELQQSIETFKTQFSLLVSILTVFVVSNVTVIGYAVTHRISTIFLIGAIIPLFMLFITRTTFRFMIPIIYTAISLEKQFEGEDTDLIINTFARSIMRKDFVYEVYQITAIPSREERVRRVNKLKSPFSTVRNSKFSLLLASASLVQILLALGLSFRPDWLFM